MPATSRRRAALQPSSLAQVAGESVHAINNALGLLYGAEHLLERLPGEAAAEGVEARGCLADAMRRLGACADALNLLALRAADLSAASRLPASGVREALERAFGQAGLALRWTGAADAGHEVALDPTVLGWLLSCAASVLRRGTAGAGPVSASEEAAGAALVITLRAPRPEGARRPRPDLGTLALADRRALLASAGIGVSLAGRGAGIIVKLRLPIHAASADRRAAEPRHELPQHPRRRR